MGSGGSLPTGCNGYCSTRCGGQPTIVGMGDDVYPQKHVNWDSGDGRVLADGAVPEWIGALSPSLAGEQAVQAAEAWAQCAEDLRKHTRLFVQRAVCGVFCRRVDQSTGRSVQAKYRLDEAATTLIVEELAAPEVCCLVQECRLAKVRNIWVCADSALARRIHGTTRTGTADADLACVLVIDDPDGMIAIVERSSEAREEFLDCMAVLIAAQRLQSEPELARCLLPGRLPPPEARLRPLGRSLQSMHLSGPVCVWLARVGDDLIASASVPEGSGGDDIEPEHQPPAVHAEKGLDHPMLTPQLTSSVPNVVPLTCSDIMGARGSPKRPGSRVEGPSLAPQSPGIVCAAAAGLGAGPHAPALACHGVEFSPSPRPLSLPLGDVNAEQIHTIL